MKTEDIEWSAAAGWARIRQGRSSPYVRLNMLRRHELVERAPEARDGDRHGDSINTNIATAS